MPRRVLVTGHLGFLGRHLCSRLLKSRPMPEVWGVDRAAGRLDGVRSIRGGLETTDGIRALLDRSSPDWIFHLAGGGSPDPASMIEGYTLPTARLFEALRTAGFRGRAVLPGSAAEYGLVPPGRPVREDAPERPVTGYGLAKLGQTQLARMYSRRGVRVVTGRLFNLLGPGLPQSLSLASFARQIAKIERGLQEAVLRTGDLSPKRDFVDVSDAADALLLLARRGRPGEAYNVCSGRSISIASMTERLLSWSRVPITLKTEPSRLRALDAPDVRGSFGKLASETGWWPKVPARAGLRAMLDYERGLP